MAKTAPVDTVRIKVLTAGHGAVGKSCLIKRHCEQKVRPRAPPEPRRPSPARR